MPRRPAKQTFLQQYGPYGIAAISTIGAGTALGCLVKDQSELASSPFTLLFGVPLPLLGAIAFGLMLVLALAPVLGQKMMATQAHRTLRQISGQVQVLGALVMTIFSGYLMFVMATQLQSFCVPCLVSAAASLALLVLTFISYSWDEPGTLAFWGIIVAIAAMVGTTGFYAYASNPEQYAPGQAPPVIATTSGTAEVQLAKHLADVGAIKYGAWWCPHCHAQQTLFGQQAFAEIDYVECDPGGRDPQPDICQAKGVASYPTWEINGQIFAGVQPLEQLAQISGYEGPRDFKN
ncbi:MAG: vitamin K epoxide reductase family protein [Cyanobacteria bacterium P01_H01_bin.121]